MIDTDRYNLISNIIALLHSEEFDATIESLAHECDIPIPHMRKCFFYIIRNSVLRSRITYIDNAGNDHDVNMSDSDILSEKNDSNTWTIDLNGDSTEMDIDMFDTILPLSVLEYGSIQKLGHEYINILKGSLFEKKSITIPLSKSIINTIDLIQLSIETKHSISFIYEKSNKKVNEVTIYPNQLISNITDNRTYLQSTELELYKLDNIRKCTINYSDSLHPGFIESEITKYAWGVPSNREKKPTHIRLKIKNTTRNIIKKIEDDTLIRRERGIAKLYKEENSNDYIYEDDVIGMPEFRHWLRGYGSSIIVYEPKRLKDYMINRAKESLGLYEISESWDI